MTTLTDFDDPNGSWSRSSVKELRRYVGADVVHRNNHDVPTIGLAADDLLVQLPFFANIARRHRPVERTTPHSAAIMIWHRVDASAAASFNHGYHLSSQKGAQGTPRAPRAQCPQQSLHLARSVRVQEKCDRAEAKPASVSRERQANAASLYCVRLRFTASESEQMCRLSDSLAFANHRRRSIGQSYTRLLR